LTILGGRWENIIIHGDSRGTSSLDTEESVIAAGEGRRGSSTTTSSSALSMSGSGESGNFGMESGGRGGGSNIGMHRESHSEHKSSSGGEYRNYTYSRSHSHSQSQASRSSSAREYQEPSFTYQQQQQSQHHWNKRAVDDDDDWRKELTCGPTECIKINCRINQLTSGSSILFMVRSRAFSKTIVEEFNGAGVDVSSKLVARVTELPYKVDPSYLKYKVYEIKTKIEEIPDLSVPSAISWWWYLLAAIVGILLLLIIIYALYKCGFFRRRRPGRGGPDSQPLRGRER